MSYTYRRRKKNIKKFKKSFMSANEGVLTFRDKREADAITRTIQKIQEYWE
jgi:hypothetical protein